MGGPFGPHQSRRGHPTPLGWPLTTKEYGGAWIYGGKDNVVSLNYVTALDYPDPRLDPQRVLQEFKKHPFVAQLLEGGKMIRYGAKSLPYGGWWSIPARLQAMAG